MIKLSSQRTGRRTDKLSEIDEIKNNLTFAPIPNNRVESMAVLGSKSKP